MQVDVDGGSEDELCAAEHQSSSMLIFSDVWSPVPTL